ncbi:SOS2 [Branchiostoma lanceolatum]|uniref:SOS2 protein n=1 Tax=Branchiostoma lanceolatum TaxID=7740 RepID=A0A8J9WC47_BRALA|nr:SOS2 [Branchiostoma lanceolatum]
MAATAYPCDLAPPVASPSIDEDSVISCLVEEVKDSVENFRSIMSTVSFGKCHLSASPSRVSHTQHIWTKRLERRDKTYTRAWQIQPSEIARELALIERDLLVRILEAELVDCVWTGHDKEKRAPNITKMVTFFERLVHLVGSEVMHEETPESRANVIAGFITPNPFPDFKFEPVNDHAAALLEHVGISADMFCSQPDRFDRQTHSSDRALDAGPVSGDESAGAVLYCLDELAAALCPQPYARLLVTGSATWYSRLTTVLWRRLHLGLPSSLLHGRDERCFWLRCRYFAVVILLLSSPSSLVMSGRVLYHLGSPNLVADHCRVMRNFDSLRAVLAGLQLLPVFRLEQSWDIIRTQHMDQYRYTQAYKGLGLMI